MKKLCEKRVIPLALVLLLTAALCAGCDDGKYDSVNATVTARADAAQRTLYQDDTEIVYTITVPKQCTHVTLQRLSEPGGETVLGERLFVRDSTGVSIEEDGDASVWTIRCDFGGIGVYGVRVKAQVPMGKKYDTLYTDVDVTIAYPDYDPDADAADILTAYALLQSGEPLWFTVDAEKADSLSAETLFDGGTEGLYARMARCGTAALGGNYLYGDASRLELTAGDAPEDMAVPSGKTLCRLFVPGDAFEACYAGDGLCLRDAARAAVAYQNGTQIDAARYPVAALLLEKGTETLEMFGFTDQDEAERARALYEWVYDVATMGVLTDDLAALSEAELAYYRSTAYGLMLGYGGDALGCADAYWMLANMAGLSCAALECTRIESGDAARVNLVLLGGEWYVMDIGAEGDAPLSHFGLNTAQAKAYLQFTQDAAYLPPVSTSTAYNLPSA